MRGAILFQLLIKALLDKLPLRRTEPKRPSDFTLEEVEELPWGHVALQGIACTHPDRVVAKLAASKLTDHDQMCILLISPEAQLWARLAVVDRVPKDEQMMLKLALSNDHVEICERAAHRLESPFCVKRLQESCYPKIRLIGLMKERDPAEIERILKDTDPVIRETARKRLQN